MTTFGSVQLRRFRIAIRDGLPVEVAAENAGIGLEEAQLTIAEDKKNPPPPEAYVLLGHNSNKEKPMADAIAADELRLLIERYERLDEEAKGLADDKKDVLAEAKSRGFCPKTIRKIIAMRKQEPHERSEAEMMLATYANALGMQLGFDI